MANWFHILLGGTRARLLELLRRTRRTTPELADAVGVSDNAVRTHIAAMQRDGLVEPAGVRRDTGGKPAQLYDVSREAEELFPKAYAPVLSALLSEIEARAGRDALLELLRSVGAAVAPASPGGSAADRVEAAAATLEALGGSVEVERIDREWRLHGAGCPLSAVVEDHAETCALVEALVAHIVGLPVREHCDRAGRPRCAFVVAER
jgi:predicted ArsR family transcriptional regulator